MKKQELKKLTLKKQAISKLQHVTGGAPYTFICTGLPYLPTYGPTQCKTQRMTICANLCTTQISDCPDTRLEC